MELTSEQELIQQTVREVVENEVREGVHEADESQTFPEDVWDELADLDLTGLTVPEEYGGMDVDEITYSIVNEELAYGHLAVATALSVHCLATSCIREFGTDDHREEWLPEMVSGRPVGAFALSEPDAGSNPAEMTTEAKLDEGAGEYVINGKKQWITNGERAGVVVLFAKTDRDDPNTVTQFLVPKDTDGVEVGKKEDKLGLRASDTTTLIFDDVRIPAENRLTEVGSGLKAAFSILTGGRIAIASQAVGVAQAALDAATAYANEREQFGQPIIEHQAIGHKLADMQTDVQAARLLTRDAARKNEDGVDPTAAAMAKYFASEAAVDVANEAVQVHGGYGYTKDFDVERYYRDAKITTIYEGTSEIQKKIIARDLKSN
ncbi:acyl-CoA dehydrogenase [Natrialba magadii ATCC 43099]|uniref:Acyl-CoA dehydrogenase n=1 Tax=Natrialba magadii (strain ATCC 43099 / DSM 3394 / CCM 3739 / CIP 104546 / IAM 13178 / JCM 8861 / NBRC 102185 / NCIMB 2190 / MS3) TaxID=547559 RepID=D3T041_NATMM|nr:acyl-CoA dehydrogenase family protein [Natrialba magadii]ADD04399.1 acyl-CoA dehydrogenase [Natrialba magadii ATCC 43099]ELY25795.1 acyl-CoA dehydrogenase [Natrialba magadii ATCC 43099]